MNMVAHIAAAHAVYFAIHATRTIKVLSQV